MAWAVCGEDDGGVAFLHRNGNGRAKTSCDLCGCEHGVEVLTGEVDLLHKEIGAV